jgi:hypothetical protein
MSILRSKKYSIGLFISFICYLTGCILYYFIIYKNGQFLIVLIISLIVGGTGAFIWQYKAHSTALKKDIPVTTAIVILLIVLFTGFAGFVASLEKKRINYILDHEPKKQIIAIVTDVDFRSTRTGKQAWSIINYKANNGIIEQSFADTGRDLAIGRKYLIEYSIKYPDMFRILKPLK